jgi:hypothetical protein
MIQAVIMGLMNIFMTKWVIAASGSLVSGYGDTARLHQTEPPRLNGKVERSRLTDHQEFYQLLTYTDDADLNQKLQVWEEITIASIDRTDRWAGKPPMRCSEKNY